MIRLSYSTFGLTQLNFLDAIAAVDKAGYDGIEISFHRDQFNPFNLSDGDWEAVKRALDKARVRPACVATASHFFTPSRPHEPSLMSPDLAGRKRRIDLVKRGIQAARRLGVSLVTFGSGFIRDEHVSSPSVNPRELLIDSIQECLAEIGSQEDMTLLIEPEPGMFIETMEQGLSLIQEINSPRFRLHVDICHSYCSETDYIAALGQAAPFTRYLHISDAQEGCNLKLLKYAPNLRLNLNFARYLLYFPETAAYLFVDRDTPLYFCDQAPTSQQSRLLQDVLSGLGIEKEPGLVFYNRLYNGASPLESELFVYLISVPGLSYDVLERARPILLYLRTQPQANGQPLLTKMVANTLTGIVHYHEIPGEGSLDFAASFRALTQNGFDGYGSVELYHHVASWQKALDDSYRHLSQFVE